MGIEELRGAAHSAQPERPVAGSKTPLDVLSELAPALAPVFYEMGERVWPRDRESTKPRFGLAGGRETARETGPRRFAVLLRKRDLFTLDLNWRLEAGGPVEFFEWEDSGTVTGSYGVRYPVISVAPVLDESRRWSGFAICPRTAGSPGGALSAIDARLDSHAFVRSMDSAEIARTLREAGLGPRVEEARPGMAPTELYFQTIRNEDRRGYFLSRGANDYVSPGWTPETIRQAFRNPRVRALRIASQTEASETPAPMEN